MNLLLAAMLAPVLFAAIAALLPSYFLRTLMLPAGALVHLAFCIALFIRPLSPDAGAHFGLDALALLVLLISSVLFLCVSIYAAGYLGERIADGNRMFVVCSLLFLSSVTTAVAARHLGILWFAVEATTLVSAPLINYRGDRLSIEAAWKYLIICSVSIAFAMLGILFIAYAELVSGGQVSLDLQQLLAPDVHLDQSWLRAGFVFFTVGMATKMGLAPLHTWKPDAYGEAPGAVGALLAGSLTSVAFLAVMRGQQIMNAAGDGQTGRHTLLVFGVISLAMAAISIVRQPDFKRTLAYSSVEHMGILAIGVGVGGLALFGVMLHLLVNSFTKGALFLTAANIHRAFGSRRYPDVQGALRVLPVTAVLFLLGFLAISGTPPFGTFTSVFLIIREVFARQPLAVGIVCLSFFAIAFAGMAVSALQITMGPAPSSHVPSRDRKTLVLPPALLLGLVLMVGLVIPEPLRTLLTDAAALLEVAP